VIGNFKCKFNDYADAYGQGTFRSIGYWEIYVAKWNSSGAWQWARQVGGHKDDYGTGITLNSSGEVILTGSFNDDLIMPVRNTFLGYNTNDSLYCTAVYCSDNYYGTYAKYITAGNSDIIISKTIDPLRQPYDYFLRTPPGCNRPELKVCIGDSLLCPDTLKFCQTGTLIAHSPTCSALDPGFTYLWSTGTPGISTTASTTGIYSVTQTSLDGCFVTTDSIYMIIHPGPPKPTISDNVIINTNSPDPDTINLCWPHPVLLTGGNFGTNAHLWTGPGFPGSSAVSITVTDSGTYCFTVIDSFGCTNTTCVRVNYFHPLPPFDPHLICLNDSDMNDTISICQNHCFEMLVYDAVSNPGASPMCLPDLLPYTTTTTWSIMPVVLYTAICNARRTYCPTVTGTYTINVMLVRTNVCDTDTFFLSRTLYVIVNPVPSATLNIAGTPWLCPSIANDSTMLVGSGCSSTTWVGPGVTGNTNDTVWVHQPGIYTVACIVTNSFGCSAYANASVSVQVKPLPVVSIFPSNGLICPNDSVLLTCTGNGPFQWQGPGGPIPGNTNSIYVTQQGNYYCIIADSDSCVLVSNSAIILQYSTPYLLVSNSGTICIGDSMVINIVASPGSTIQWLLPLSGSAWTQTVYTAGTYACVIFSCGITDTVRVTINLDIPTAQITPAGPLTFCDGDSVVLTGNAGMTTYLWNPDSVSGQNFPVSQAGTYTLTITDSFGCVATDTISVYTYANIAVAPVVSDTTICPGQILILTATGSGNILWYPGLYSLSILDSGNTYTTHLIHSSETYYVLSEDSGCKSARVPLHVFVDNCDSVFIPNVFTPNGDSQNETFHFTVPVNNCFRAKIYNRWGRLMYEWYDATKGWDGTNQNNGRPAAAGVYYYLLWYCDDKTIPHNVAGFVELIRD
jgi:gliding motility-associated-like protein